MEKNLISAQELSRILGISPSTVRNYADNGVFPYVEVPQMKRFFNLVDIKKIYNSADITNEDVDIRLRRAKSRDIMRRLKKNRNTDIVEG